MTISTFDSPRDSERERNRRYDEDATLDEPMVAHERAEERERSATRQDVAARASEGDAPHDFGTSYLGGSSEEQWQKWRQIQADFVDNPRSAVSDAHRLVGEMMDDIVRRFENERNQLEQRWSSGQDVNTEELRTCLQTYRDFFGRLLATNVA
jgi:hypothetical protein